MPIIKEFTTFAEFEAEQNCPFIKVEKRQFGNLMVNIIFASGAVSDGSYEHHLPAHEDELLANQIEYKRLRLEKLKTELSEAESVLQQIATYIRDQSHISAMNSGPGPDPEAFDDLAKVKKTILKLRPQIPEAEREVWESRPRNMDWDTYMKRRQTQGDQAAANSKRVDEILYGT